MTLTAVFRRWKRGLKVELKVNFSNNYLRIMREFPVLPKRCDPVFESALKRDALRTIREFKEGIKKNSMGLVRLKDGTIERKRKMGYDHPTYPLYGKGDDQKLNSYVNMLRIHKKRNGFVVHPAKDMHWSGNITLRKLWDVHEHGRIIKRGNGFIRIPARPALTKAFNRAMKQRQMSETKKIIKTAIVLYLVKKNPMYLKMAMAFFLKGLSQYETRD